MISDKWEVLKIVILNSEMKYYEKFGILKINKTMDKTYLNFFKMNAFCKFDFIVNILGDIMKTLSIIIIIMAFCLISSCSDSTDLNLSNKATLNIKSELTQGTIQLTDLVNKEISILKTEVDSVKINKVRILLSRIKLHLKNNSNENDDKAFQTGPFVFVGDSTGSYFNLANGQIDAGTYDKIKFEIHRFEPNELSQYKNNQTFKDFATDKRYTTIFEGIAYKNGEAFPFTYNGTVTANLSLNFETPVVLLEIITSNIYLQINPLSLLKSGDSILDPRDEGNSNQIDNLIKSAIKAIKKN